ncbi:ion channel [Lithospermum erythrorhizon]|uniref:Ion channel n=1 Tax=Lithospermum erythrorhizon TaxID=34254 RepID=A0AAV3NWL7_LITER
MEELHKCCNSQFFVSIAAVAMLTLIAGMMSGLTLGLMSMSIVDLEVLAKSGKPKDRQNAEKILPVVRRQHLLLCTLLFSNAVAMEALPIFLDNLVPEWSAILLSVTLILFFGEIIPQSVCTRYGLVIGAAVAPMIQVLVWFWFPITYPLSKLLDYLLEEGHISLFRRAELKTLVDMHGNEAGKGGELSRHETTIISGALDLTEKTAKDAMTPMSETFAIDINAKLDRNLINLILEQGHSRVPVYYDQPKNIIGLVLVKNLVTLNPAHEIHVKDVVIRRIPRLSEAMPLYDILNDFQKGLSHMAVVVRKQNGISEKRTSSLSNDEREVRVEIPGENFTRKQHLKMKRSLRKPNSSSGAIVSRRESSKSRRWSEEYHPDVLTLDESSLSTFPDEEEVIGIITMEDVIIELLKDEISDETNDHHTETS